MITTKTEHSAINDSATLAATLVAHGVRYLRTATAAEPQQVEPATLIAALAKHKEPRVRESLIPLFLRHPIYAQHVLKLAATLEEAASQTLRHMYTAAVYLQRQASHARDLFG